MPTKIRHINILRCSQRHQLFSFILTVQNDVQAQVDRAPTTYDQKTVLLRSKLSPLRFACAYTSQAAGLVFQRHHLLISQSYT